MNPAERATFLDEACEGDETLRSEVLRLLDADDTGEHDVDVIDDALIGAESGDAYGRSLIGHRIGRFEVLSRIASGGMGTVYEAQQEHPNRRVALKVMRQGLASPSARQRFGLRGTDPLAPASPGHRSGVRSQRDGRRRAG